MAGGGFVRDPVDSGLLSDPPFRHLPFCLKVGTSQTTAEYRHVSASPIAEPSSSVHPPETKIPDSMRVNEWGCQLTSDDLPVTFRHSGWCYDRQRVRRALVNLNTPPRRLERFDLCGSDPWIVVDENDDANISIQSNHCHSRWCVPCSRERASRIVGNLKNQLSQAPVRLLTLTLRHCDAPLSDQITRLYTSFRALRKAPFWKAAVDGGCAVLEICHGQSQHPWHVHLHCLLQGRYVPHAALKAEWWKVTGDSNIVDIRPVRSGDKAASYVTKYVTKPLSRTVIESESALEELITACGRRRLVLTWGSWRGLRLSAKLDTTTWKALMPLDEVFRRAEQNNAPAQILLEHLEHKYPGIASLVGRGPPDHPLPPDLLPF